MISYFIQFDDLKLSSVTLFSYENGVEKNISKIDLEDVRSNLASESAIYVMLPSALFGFKTVSNDLGLKKDILKANIFSETEDILASDVSSLKFFYHSDLNLASWIDRVTYNEIVDAFRNFDGEIYFYPEHFLLDGLGDMLYVGSKRFFCSYDNLTGFSGFNESLEAYLNILNADGLNIDLIKVYADNEDLSFIKLDNLNFKKKSLTELHLNFLEHSKFPNINFFQRLFSFNQLKQKLKFSTMEIWTLSFATLILFIAPLGISYNLSSSSAIYKQDTIELFKQLNPSFNKLVNARAQIDDLTRNIPSESYISNQDITVLQYLEKFKDESIKKISVNLQYQKIDISLEGLPRYKLELIKQILKSEPIIFLDSELIERDQNLFGNLLVQYES